MEWIVLKVRSEYVFLPKEKYEKIGALVNCLADHNEKEVDLEVLARRVCEDPTHIQVVLDNFPKLCSDDIVSDVAGAFFTIDILGMWSLYKDIRAPFESETITKLQKYFTLAEILNFNETQKGFFMTNRWPVVNDAISDRLKTSANILCIPVEKLWYYEECIHINSPSEEEMKRISSKTCVWLVCDRHTYEGTIQGEKLFIHTKDEIPAEAYRFDGCLWMYFETLKNTLSFEERGNKPDYLNDLINSQAVFPSLNHLTTLVKRLTQSHFFMGNISLIEPPQFTQNLSWLNH